MSPLSGSPIRLVIPGQYWDSQIYSGELILFRRDGALQRLNWAKLVASLPLPDDLRLVAEAAFLGSREYYAPTVRRLIQDPEIQPVIENKFRRLQLLTRNWEPDFASLRRTYDNPFPFPHNDSDFHYGSLFVGARSGVFKMVERSRHDNHPNCEKLSDIPALDIATKYRTIALAAGTEGLFEIPTRTSNRAARPQVARNICSACEWSYASIVGLNRGRSLFVAAFKLEREDPENPKNQRRVRQFEGVLTYSELFSESSELFSESKGDRPGGEIQWGAKDRIYRYTDGTIDVVRNVSNGETAFVPAGHHNVSTAFDLHAFVDVRVAPFGSILEFDDHISVLLNSGEVLDLPGEPVNWRVYPRSLNYLNHLHVVYNDRVEVVAFTGDYFVRPENRKFGTEPVSHDEHAPQLS